MRGFEGGNQILDPKKTFEYAGLHQGMTIADLGCGAAAHFVFPAAQLVGDSGTVYAVDIQQGILASVDARAREHNLENIITVWSDLEVYGAAKAIKDASVDVVLFANTLFQSKQRVAMMKEGVRMLKSQGQLTIVEWKKGDAPIGPHVSLRVPIEEARTLGADAGLKEEGMFEAGPYHYGIVFRKS